MANIIDRRNSSGKSAENRQRFLKKYKTHIRGKVEDIANEKGITDIFKDRKVKIRNDDISEPNFQHDHTRGNHKYVHTGNKHMEKGYKIHSNRANTGQKAGEKGDAFDEFTFTLTKEEFLDLYFSDMELPDFIKESLKGSTKTKWQRSGYTKTGVPARLDLKKTLKQSIARRKATGSKMYLTDTDLRYRHFSKKKFPVLHATMFLLMDVSGSMDEQLKMLAKKFFLLLHIFLHKTYENVELRFIRHAETAEEVYEHEFFYGRQAGGTMVSSGLKLINNIIDTEIDSTTTNVYVAQASDGDNFFIDNKPTEIELQELLTKVQYMAYVQLNNDNADSLFTLYEQTKSKNFSCTRVNEDRDIYPALRGLFAKR